MDINAIKSKLATLQSTTSTKENFWKPEPGTQVVRIEAGNQYGKTTVRVKPNQTPITEDATLLTSIMENQSDLVELYNEPTYDELKEVLQNYLNPSDDTQSTETTNVATSEKVAVKTETKQTADVSDAFDELFNS
jgi:hypothetical protein